MNEIYPITHGVSSFVLNVNTSDEWNFILLLFIISGVIIAIMLYLFSKKPEDWKHESKTDGGYYSGRLKDLAESIKNNPFNESSAAPLKKPSEFAFLIIDWNFLASLLRKVCLFINTSKNPSLTAYSTLLSLKSDSRSSDFICLPTY